MVWVGYSVGSGLEIGLMAWYMGPSSPNSTAKRKDLGHEGRPVCLEYLPPTVRISFEQESV